jgi:hypothetical protein
MTRSTLPRSAGQSGADGASHAADFADVDVDVGEVFA